MPTLADHLAKRSAVRGLILGDPGSGKTTAIGHLAEHGYTVRHISFDGLVRPIQAYVSAAALEKNYLVKVLKDPGRWTTTTLSKGGRQARVTYYETIGMPTAWTDTIRIITDGWKEPDMDLGKPEAWNAKTVLVFDPMKDMINQVVNHIRYMNGRQARPLRLRDYGDAFDTCNGFLQTICQETWQCHVLVLAHLKRLRISKLRDPRIVAQGQGRGLQTDDGDEEQTEDMLTAKRYPDTLGNKLPESFGSNFDFIVQTVREGSATPLIRLRPEPDVDLKCPINEPWASATLRINELHRLLDHFSSHTSASISTGPLVKMEETMPVGQS